MSLKKGYKITVSRNSKLRTHLVKGRVNGVFTRVPKHWDEKRNYALCPEDFIDTPTFLEYRAMCNERQAVLMRQRAENIRKFQKRARDEEKKFLRKCRRQVKKIEEMSNCG